jgi:tetratricopeptide (TPR) repeat protein
MWRPSGRGSSNFLPHQFLPAAPEIATSFCGKIYFVSALAVQTKSHTKNPMSRLRGRSQNRESQESCPGNPGAAFQRQHFGAEKARPRLIGLLLALITLLAYWPVAYDGFVNYDDGLHVSDNSAVKSGLTLKSIQWAFQFSRSDYWHPLDFLSHMLDCQLYGLAPAGHHLTNVLLHATVAILLFLVLREMTGALWRSAFVAVVFAIHPLRVESVAWVSERKDVLHGVFFMLTIWAYVRYVRHPWSLARYLAVVLLFALGLMSKPTLMTLPFVLLLLDYWPLKRFVPLAVPGDAGGAKSAGWRSQRPVLTRMVVEKLPLFMLSAASCVQAAIGNRPAFEINKSLPRMLQISNAMTSYVAYIWQMVWPVKLAVLYPFPGKGLPLGEVIGAVVLLVLISIGLFLLRQRHPCYLVGWLWYLGMLVPMIGFIQAGAQARADRYTYLPQIGLYLLLTWAAADLYARWRHRRLVQAGVIAAAVLVLAGCLVLTENQLRYWRDSESLFRHALAVTKDNYIAHLNLGTAFQDEGRLNEALAEYRASAQLAPDYPCVHKNLGSVLDALGRPEEALAEYRLALQIEPRVPALHDGIGIVFVELGRFDEAMSEFVAAARLDPAYPWPYFQMGKALLKQGRDAEAIDKLREALRISPDNYQILAYAARVLAANEKPEVRDGQTALVYAVKANVLSDGTLPFVLDALGMACAETGRFDDAQEAIERAIKIATAAGIKQDVASLQQRLWLYQNHQPWRESFLSTNTLPGALPKN